MIKRLKYDKYFNLFLMITSQLKEQQTFLNYFQNELWITRTEKFLTKLDKVVPWESISNWWVWRPRMEIQKMLKILFLQWLCGLSDPEIEDQIRDRNSFQKFLWILKTYQIIFIPVLFYANIFTLA